MSYQTDIAPLESAGLSDEQIADVLSSVTVRPVPLQEFENFLSDNALASRHPLTGQWQGPLPEIAAMDGHPLQAGVAVLFAHINKPRSIQIDTAQQPWCLMAAELLAGLVQMQVITEQHREGFYALGGGLRHGVVTAGQIEAARKADAMDWFIRQVASRIEGAMRLAADAEGATEASVKAAAVAEAEA